MCILQNSNFVSRPTYRPTAFEADGKLYQFRRMTFGFTNGVSAFQKVLYNLIEQCKLMKDYYAYLDNIIIAGESKVEHDQNQIIFEGCKRRQPNF